MCAWVPTRGKNKNRHPQAVDLKAACCNNLLNLMDPKSYFKNIYDNVTSIAIGMKITIKYCFQKTVTVQYPEQHLSFAPRYRGIHEFEADKCIACDMCAKACPVDCIYIDKTGPRKIDKKTGTVNMSDKKNGELV